jgi:hypothetical protein
MFYRLTAHQCAKPWNLRMHNLFLNELNGVLYTSGRALYKKKKSLVCMKKCVVYAEEKKSLGCMREFGGDQSE